MWGDNDALDAYDDRARDEAAYEDHIGSVLAEYSAARRALRTLEPGMDRTARTAIFARFHAASVAVQDERDRLHYGATNARIVAEIQAEQTR